MKLVKIVVFVDVENHVPAERVLEWVDQTLTVDWNTQRGFVGRSEPRPTDDFETFQAGIELETV